MIVYKETFNDAAAARVYGVAKKADVREGEESTIGGEGRRWGMDRGRRVG